jgi:hypothetical protein
MGRVPAAAAAGQPTQKGAHLGPGFLSVCYCPLGGGGTPHSSCSSSTHGCGGWTGRGGRSSAAARARLPACQLGIQLDRLDETILVCVSGVIGGPEAIQ